jgi:hypothetical protein
MKTKKKDWKLISKEKLEKNTTSTFKMQAGGGHIYLILIQTEEGIRTETVFAPDASIIAGSLPKIISDVKRGIRDIESQRYHEGEYSDDIIPMDRRIKETKLEDLKRNKRKRVKKEIFPDHLPDDILSEDFLI